MVRNMQDRFLGALSDEVVTGVSFRQVRDFFRSKPDDFDEVALGVWLSRGEITARLTSQAEPLLTKTQFRRLVRLWRVDKPALGEVEYSALSEAIAATNPVFEALVDQGFLKKNTFGDMVYSPTRKGLSLSSNRAMERLPRAKLKSSLDAICHAALTFNKTPGPNHYIDQILLYGSTITDAASFGDIDLVVVQVLRVQYPDVDDLETAERNRWRVLRPSSSPPQYCDTEFEAKQALKKASRYVSIGQTWRSAARLQEEGIEYRVLFERSG